MRDELIYNKIKDAMALLDDIDALISSQPEELSKIDSELSDWYHYIENNDLTDDECVKIIHHIKELRLIRRSIHNEFTIEKTFKDNASKVMGNNTRGLLLAEINKVAKQLDSAYKNRVLTDEDIKIVLNNTPKRRGRPKKNTI